MIADDSESIDESAGGGADVRIHCGWRDRRRAKQMGKCGFEAWK